MSSTTSTIDAATTNTRAGSSGVIHQISVSDGGVPKLATPVATISENGVSGDRQRDQRNHGGPERAVCLYSLEVIERLRAEGHPIQPGTAGENITVSGLDWSRAQSGARLRLGDSVLLELTRFTTPCQNIAPSFIQGDFQRILVTRSPGDSRIYARVLVPGEVRAGDRVEFIEEAGQA